ncbi:DUF4166 domain-containing protein [Bacillus safensis]|uniref:DUF4166 domain-containing protein n=1 Tax=Bacillus safensis TaxID=561879 RepID=UPI00227EB051|nr:DUF4166 domain-containing protein [Bacillus safensis]MCY7734501.1 DUF4166 domain-containing protein [Bacillus safensis]MEC1116550.1 DUF4166 domain-containing protein [Bacillus safensis]
MVVHRHQVKDYDKLHPKLKERYNRAFTAEGTMEEIGGGTRLIRFFLKIGPHFRCFFPERGKNIPFRIVNKPFMTNKGEEGMHWFRTFYFPKKERHFDADMIIDEKSHKVLDYFGKPRLLMTELHFTVTKYGFLHIQSGQQKLLMFGREWPLPSWLYGESDVTEGYDERTDEYTIHVHVKNRLFGTLFTYKGRFTERVESHDE